MNNVKAIKEKRKKAKSLPKIKSYLRKNYKFIKDKKILKNK
jgi:hypothetical protein